MCFGFAISALRVEARWGAAEGAAALGEAGCWSATSMAAAVVMVLMAVLLLEKGTEDVAVVAFALFRVREGVVGFGDLGEAGGGVWVVWVDVWMGCAGESVE